MPKKKRGIYADPSATPHAQIEDKVADFSYESPALAQLIVDIWGGQHAELIDTNRTGVQRSDDAKNLFLTLNPPLKLDQPIVIKEDEYVNGYQLDREGLDPTKAVVFVVPRPARLINPGAAGLIETAKMLMAITPNGI